MVPKNRRAAHALSHSVRDAVWFAAAEVIRFAFKCKICFVLRPGDLFRSLIRTEESEGGGGGGGGGDEARTRAEEE